VRRKLYRIQCADELREPPAEIDFSDLVHFSTGGAVPDESGWEKLKSGGLWTPGGTVLLGRKDDRDEDRGSEMKKKMAGLDWVLRMSVPDESDGVLCLNVRWSVRSTVVGTAKVMSYEDIVEAQTDRDAKATGRISKRKKSAPTAGQERGSCSQEVEKAGEEIGTLGLANYCSVLHFD
jgi:hypothetical protein